MKFLVVHGPNLNFLGTRAPEIYGSQTLAEINDLIVKEAAALGVEVEMHHSAHEGEIIEILHSGIPEAAGALLNPGAYSHTSRAIADAVEAVPWPVIEVHLSNIHGREPWRARSVTAAAAAGVIAGFGAGSYIAGLHALKALVEGAR